MHVSDQVEAYSTVTHLDRDMSSPRQKLSSTFAIGFHKTVCLIALSIVVCFSGCQTWRINGLRDQLTPSNDRDWKPEMATIPYAEIDGPTYTLRNIRNCNYVTESDYVVDYYDRQISIDQIQSIDYIVVPFGRTEKLAHTMMSFGLNDGTYLALSVEVRKERGEKFNPLLGLGRQFELIYVLSDERDVIRLRTKHRDADVYVYPTVATVEQSQALFANVMGRINKLAVEPEFYNTFTNNCTTNLADHVNQLVPDRINYSWKVLLPGLSAEYAYELGLLDNRIPFEDLTSLALVNELAEKYFEDPQFSQHIRSRRYLLERYLVRQENRAAALNGRGDQLLQNLQRPRMLRR